MKKYLRILSNLQKYLLLIPFVVLYSYSNSQTGVFYYPDKANSNNNNKIVDIVEIDNSEMCLLGKLSDNNYQNPNPFFIHLDKNGRKIKQATLKSKSLYEVNRVIKLQNGQLKIYGSQIVDGKYSPLNIIIDKNGIEKKSDYAFTVYSTLLGDVMEFDNENVVVVETILGKSEKYSISLYKANIASSNKAWTKNINSQNNEEANQVYVSRGKNILVLGKRYNNDLSQYSPILYKYTSGGELVWSKEVDVPKNFFNQNVCTDKKENIYYICGYTKETTGRSETRIIKLSPDKVKIKAISLENFSANGIIELANSGFLIYGSNLKIHEGRVITKGKFVIMNKEMIIIKEEELSIMDKPDSEYPKDVMTKFPTSSDLLSGMQLRDGRIALTGRVYMPVSRTNTKDINAARHNSALLVITDKNGIFR